jgi:hypothetical protein
MSLIFIVAAVAALFLVVIGWPLLLAIMGFYRE